MNYLSLFSGIGGFEYGISQSNKKNKMNCIGFSEIDKYAKKVYKKHYPDHPDLGDATEIRTETLPDFDFLVGGFPCQAFSVAGKRRGFNDTRGTLFFEIARILKAKKPRYFLLENVKGLLSHDKGRTFQTILGTLSELGYDVLWEIFNSKNHGVPQNRERLYIKGFLRERCAGEILSLRKTGTKTKTRQEKNNEIVRIGNLFENGGQAGQVYDSEGLSTTLSANGGGMGGKTGLYKVDDKRVIPSTREGNFFALTSRYRNMPLEKKQDNYVFEYDDQENTKQEIKVVRNVHPSGKGQSGTVYHPEGVAPSTDCKTGGSEQKILLRNNTKQGYAEAREGDGFVYGQYNCRGRVQKQSVPTLNTGDSCGAGVLLIGDNTSKGFHPAKEGDAIQLGQDSMRGPRVMKKASPTLTTGCNQLGVVDNFMVRRLTPLECERLQGFPKIKKEIEIWWSDQVRNDVLSAMEKWHKNQKLVGNAEKDKLQETVKSVEKNSHSKNLRTKRPAPKNVHINFEGETVELFNPEKSHSNAKIAEKKNLYLPYIKQEDFVRQIVLMNTILDQIILNGKEELLQNEHYSIHQKNGKKVVKLFGEGIMQVVNSVVGDMTTLERLMKYITSFHSDTEITEQLLTTWFCYVIIVIIGSIQKEMNINSLESFELSEISAWTEYGCDGEKMSDTQRYKMCGNAVTTNVIRDIMNTWDMKL